VQSWRIVLLLLCAGLLSPAAAAAAQPSEVQTIIERSIQANERDWKAAPLYNFAEREALRGGTRTYEEIMLDGSPYERLIAVNGAPLPDAQQAEELSKFESEAAERRAESPQERVERIARYERSRKRDHLLLGQLTAAFNFTLVGERKLGDFQVYELKAMPRAGYQPPEMDAQVLRGMEGTLWIDTRTFQWVKVTARVIRPVSIGGFLALVEPGTQFELEKMPVQDDVWLPKHFDMRARAKILFLFSHRAGKDETYFDYRLAQPELAGK